MKAPTLSFAMACLLGTQIAHSTNIHNYVELGLGASQLFSFNKDTNDNLKNYSASPSLKILAGSRLNHSRSIWYEVGYSHNGKMEYSDTSIDAQSLFTGLKLTTDPLLKSALFIRGGAGKTWTRTESTFSAADNNSGMHYYGGLGMNFRLNYQSAFTIEFQHINDVDTDLAINGVFLSFNQFVD